ncbi:MAG: hypothetical protein U5K56_15285 [Halioglobus sp.]|nr:hypothetical protein [Halioglobus sp.]
MAQLLAVLIAIIASAAIGALVVAVVVQLAANLIFKFKPPYGMAYKAVFLGYLASVTMALIIGLAVQQPPDQMADVLRALMPVLVFLVHAFVYGIVISHPQRGPVGLGKGLVLTLAMVLFVTVLASVVLGILAIAL